LQWSKQQDEGGSYEEKGFDFVDGDGFGVGYLWMRWGASDGENRSLSNSICQGND
jgi:hypothetical protein